MEICYEKLSTPAMYIAPCAMLSAFTVGRTNSLVIDMGAAGTKITPVLDGYELKKSSVYTNRGGNYLDMLVRQYLESNGTKLVPWYETNKYKKMKKITKNSTTPSFREMHVVDIARDVKHWMCSVQNPILVSEKKESNSNGSVDIKGTYTLKAYLPPPSYELPDGTQVQSSEGLSFIPQNAFFGGPPDLEGGFTSSFTATPAGGKSVGKKRPRTSSKSSSLAADSATSSNNLEEHAESKGNNSPDASAGGYAGSSFNADPSRMAAMSEYDSKSLHELVYTSIAMSDTDVRRDLLSNILLVGGSSLTDGVVGRLSYELSNMVPSHLKVRICIEV